MQNGICYLILSYKTLHIRISSRIPLINEYPGGKTEKENMHPYLFGTLFLSSFVQFSTSQCYNGTFSCIVNPTEPGRRFPGTVFMTFEKFGPNQCFDECIRRARCESFNYKASEFYCELNTGHGIESNTSNDFVNDAKYEYTSMEGLRKVNNEFYMYRYCKMF